MDGRGYLLPRKHYLLVHDAVRKILGPNATLSAFASNRHRFQCDMIINARQTDPDVLRNASPEAAAAATEAVGIKGRGAGSAQGKARTFEFATKLQECMGFCDLVAQRRRVDVVFPDRTVLRLALGASLSDFGMPLTNGADINAEADWERRNRMRISLGYDEDLFSAACDFKVNLAARGMEKWVVDYYRRRRRVYTERGVSEHESDRKSHHVEETAAASPSLSGGRTPVDRSGDLYPPVAYWQAHGFVLAEQYPTKHHVDILGTVSHCFATYYGRYPFLNPYCPEEDLNTVAVVRKLCEAWHKLPLEGGEGSLEFVREEHGN